MTLLGGTIAGLLLAGAAGAQTPPPSPAMPPAPPEIATPPVDYTRAAAWICRPGVADATCSAGLDAMAVTGAGIRTPAPYRPAAAPAIDCFYIYPTTSDDPSYYSDMIPDESEKGTVHAQAARLGSVCRLFAPAYHQLTSAGLRYDMALLAAGAKRPTLRWDIPYRDVRDAWRAYLAHDNGGRGVVILGHSQGAILVKRLLQEEVDGTPAQARLVGAYLAGNPDLTTTSFAHLKPCAVAGAVGCITAWSSYRADDPDPHRLFGAARPGQQALCVNPAAPAGGRGLLDAYLPRPAAAPPGDPPYVEVVGQLSAECVADEQGQVLRVRVEPGRYADLLRASFRAREHAGWGLHGLDMALAQGNLVSLIGAQAVSWARRPQPAP